MALESGKLSFADRDTVLETFRSVEYKRLKDSIYLDHAGSTLYSEKQIESILHDFTSNLYSNPHSHNQSSKLSSDIIYQTRCKILRYFNTCPEEYAVVFTSGCTASLKLVADNFIWKNDLFPSSNSLLNQGTSLEDSHEHRSLTPSSQGLFLYLDDNHTSVIGMREICSRNGATTLCLSAEEARKLFTRVDHELEWYQYINKHCDVNGNLLFVYPAQSNFSGVKYPLGWIQEICSPNSTRQAFVLLDAAAYVTTSFLDLATFKPDFVTLSFYKMFGFPTGLGCLLVKRDSCHALRKIYFGGGTVQLALPHENTHIMKDDISESFEDGTVAFLDIIALSHGFATLERVAGGIHSIQEHTFTIAKDVYKSLIEMKHSNGQPLVEVYCPSKFISMQEQGPILAFNLLDAEGDYIGYSKVDDLAQANNLCLRVGCFCNLGACQIHLKLSTDDVKANFQAGYSCGGELDIANGRPVGAVRVSFGYTSTWRDGESLLAFLHQCFLENNTKVTRNPRPTSRSSLQGLLLNSTVGHASNTNPPEEVTGSSDMIMTKNVFPSAQDANIIEEHTRSTHDKQQIVSKQGVIKDEGPFNDGQQMYLGLNQMAGLPSKETDVGLANEGSNMIEERKLDKSQITCWQDNDKWTSVDGCVSNVVISATGFLDEAQAYGLCVINDSPNRKPATNSDIVQHDEAARSKSIHNIQDHPEADPVRDQRLTPDAMNKTPDLTVLDHPVLDKTSMKAHLMARPTHAEANHKVNADGSILLADIFVYPIKSCAPYKVRRSWTIGTSGLHYDRLWMIVTSVGVCLTQKREPKLSLIQPEINEENGSLTLSFQGHESLTIPLEANGNEMSRFLCQSKVCGDRVQVLDCGDIAANWLNCVLYQEGLRLVKQSSEHQRLLRNANTEGSVQLSLANESQFLLINKASIRILQENMEVPLEVDELVDRFRPNFVIDGPGIPAFSEDLIKKFTIGDFNFDVLKACNRCQMICVDPSTGTKGSEPLKTLSRMKDRKNKFGILLLLDSNRNSVHKDILIKQPCFVEFYA